MEANVAESLAVFAVLDPHRRRLRTTNALERLNRELHRSTRVATLFPNEASLLRLVSALAPEIGEEWETGRIYSNPESESGRQLGCSYRRRVALSPLGALFVDFGPGEFLRARPE
jgi:transposase-like protein